MIVKKNNLQRVRDPKMVKNMMTLLNEYKLDLDVLFNSKETSRLFIGGSSVLQAILGERWAFSDLDIFMMDGCKHANAVIKMIGDVGYKIDKHDIETYTSATTLSFEKNDKRIDLVLISKPIDDFLDSFDFDICQARFDGAEFVLPSLQNVLDKTITIDIDDATVLPIALDRRINKYKHRGFKFDGLTKMRINALIKLRKNEFVSNLMMSETVSEFMKDNHLVGLDPRVLCELEKGVDEYMMETYKKMRVDDI